MDHAIKGRLSVPMSLLAVFTLAGCDYSSEVRDSITRVLKQDFPNYHFFATPAGNFGIGTMYLRGTEGQRPEQITEQALIAIPETYFTEAVPADEREALLKKFFPDGAIGKFSVNETLARGLTLDAAVPGIAGALTGGAAVDLRKGVSVDLQAGETAVRKLLWTELARARNSGKIADDIARHLDAGDVVIAMNDIVVRGYRAVVTIDAGANAGLKAELDKASGAGLSLPSGKASVSSAQNGTYHIETNGPVVVAVLFRSIPVGPMSGAASDAWPEVRVKGDMVSRLRELAMRKRLRP